MTSRIMLPILAFALVSTGAECETDVTDDAGFQFWCGEMLCAWDLEQGEIRRVATWHEHDYGVEFVGSPVVLSQTARSSASTCVRVEILADADPEARLTVEIDRDGTGSVDWVAPVRTPDGFRSLVWDVSGGASSQAVYYLRKSGEGRAIVARFRNSRECDSNRR